MPYFVYEIVPPLQLTHIRTEGNYKDARALVRGMRQDQPAGAENEYRMIFARNQTEAEKLLSTPRDERVIGED